MLSVIKRKVLRMRGGRRRTESDPTDYRMKRLSSFRKNRRHTKKLYHVGLSSSLPSRLTLKKISSEEEEEEGSFSNSETVLDYSHGRAPLKSCRSWGSVKVFYKRKKMSSSLESFSATRPESLGRHLANTSEVHIGFAIKESILARASFRECDSRQPITASI